MTVTTAAWAYPRVGDSMTVSDGVTVEYTTTLVGYNSQDNTFTALETTTTPQGVVTESVVVSASRILTDGEIQAGLNYCSAQGRLQQVVVPFGTFQGCPNYWYLGATLGMVPFGYLQKLTFNGTTSVNVNLIDSKIGTGAGPSTHRYINSTEGAYPNL